MQPFLADQGTAAQVTQLLNKDHRVTARCIQKFMEREGGLPKYADIRYGARIAADGSIAQVSVLGSNNVNDGMLMACIGRAICKWALQAYPDGQERLVRLPPYVLKNAYMH